MDNEWLENFIQDYRKKLAGEKLELQLEEKVNEASRLSVLVLIICRDSSHIDFHF